MDNSVNPSRLLALPGEIRAQILELLLTNKHIHIRSATSTGSSVISLTPQHVFYHHSLPRGRHPPTSSESALIKPPSLSPTTRTPDTTLPHIWLVNRQLHAESAHLPFTRHNVFSFEDAFVFHRFITQATLLQRDGISNIWVSDDAQSAAVMDFFVTSRKLGPDALWDMTVYIPSRCNKLEIAADDRRVGAFNITERLRAGWELTSERAQVAGLEGIWTKLAERVQVVEI